MHSNKFRQSARKSQYKPLCFKQCPVGEALFLQGLWLLCCGWK
ncbi:zinc-finger domain-containing protein [uncultured Ferrimonas sp.]